MKLTMLITLIILTAGCTSTSIVHDDYSPERANRDYSFCASRTAQADVPYIMSRRLYRACMIGRGWRSE